MAGTLVVDNLKASSGVLATQNGMSGIAKAWVRFAGASGTVADSFNISSITRTSTGQYTLAFSTALPNANYSAVLNAMPSNQIGPYAINSYANVTTSGFSFYTVSTSTGGLVDATVVNAAVFA